MTKITFTTSTLPTTIATEVTSDDAGRVPDNFANIAHLVIAIALANGDAGWLSDMLHEAEAVHTHHYESAGAYARRISGGR